FSAVPPASPQQQPGGYWGSPPGLRRSKPREPPPRHRLFSGARAKVVPRSPLLVVEAGDLVLRSRLPSNSPVAAVLVQREDFLVPHVRRVEPLGRVPRVQVLVESGHVVLVLLEARGNIEPQFVLLYRAATIWVD